jgi:hypothetical protein
MKLNQIGMLFALIMLSACSKQNGQPAAEANSSNQDASISFRSLFNIQVGNGAYLVTEFENTGKTGIKAFQGKWTIKDDLNAVVAEQEVRFTSDTPFVTTNGNNPGHIISAGEKFLIVNIGVSGQDDQVFATTKENIGAVIPTLTAQGLEDYRAAKTPTFELEKIVSQ